MAGGAIKDNQASTGMIIAADGRIALQSLRPEKVAIYVRLSSPEQQVHLERRVTQLADYCALRGHQVTLVAEEIVSGVNDSQPELLALLKDTRIIRIVVELRDRLIRLFFETVPRLPLANNRHALYRLGNAVCRHMPSYV